MYLFYSSDYWWDVLSIVSGMENLHWRRFYQCKFLTNFVHLNSLKKNYFLSKSKFGKKRFFVKIQIFGKPQFLCQNPNFRKNDLLSKFKFLEKIFFCQNPNFEKKNDFFCQNPNNLDQIVKIQISERTIFCQNSNFWETGFFFVKIQVFGKNIFLPKCKCSENFCLTKSKFLENFDFFVKIHALKNGV